MRRRIIYLKSRIKNYSTNILFEPLDNEEIINTIKGLDPIVQEVTISNDEPLSINVHLQQPIQHIVLNITVTNSSIIDINNFKFGR